MHSVSERSRKNHWAQKLQGKATARSWALTFYLRPLRSLEITYTSETQCCYFDPFVTNGGERTRSTQLVSRSLMLPFDKEFQHQLIDTFKVGKPIRHMGPVSNDDVLAIWQMTRDFFAPLWWRYRIQIA